MPRLNLSKIKFAALLGISILLASGCGGGGESGSKEATISSRGVITGFGSVYVNGIRFNTEATHFSVDDDDGDETDLEVGMIVTVTGSMTGGSEGSADRITYDNELKGPVSSITPDGTDPARKTLTILGQAVLVTANTTIDDDNGLTFDNIALDDVLEVSGFLTDTGIIATHLERQDNDLEIEIRGHIDNLNATGFTVRGFAIRYDGSTELEDITVLANGLFVEVEGQLDLAGTTLIARKIEAEYEGFDGDMDEIELQGAISGYQAGNNTFFLQGQRIDASNAVLEPATLTLANSLVVEVEGYLSNGTLIADKIKQEGKKVKIESALSGVDTDAGTVSFNFNGMGITVRVNSRTEIEDDNSGNDLLLSDLSAGNFVELKGFAEGTQVVNAIEIERADPDEVLIVAPVQSFDKSTRRVRLLGVDFDLSAASFEGRNDNNLSANAFFDLLATGIFIKIEDRDGNAVFERAELDD